MDTQNVNPQDQQLERQVDKQLGMRRKWEETRRERLIRKLMEEQPRLLRVEAEQIVDNMR